MRAVRRGIGSAGGSSYSGLTAELARYQRALETVAAMDSLADTSYEEFFVKRLRLEAIQEEVLHGGLSLEEMQLRLREAMKLRDDIAAQTAVVEALSIDND